MGSVEGRACCYGPRSVTSTSGSHDRVIKTVAAVSFDPLAHWSQGSPVAEEHFQETSDTLVIKASLEGQSDQGQGEMTAVCHTITTTLRRINQ